MRLIEVVLENFRCYNGTHRIPIDSLTAFIGRNDVGKSTIFDALEIYKSVQKSDIEKLLAEKLNEQYSALSIVKSKEN